MLNNIHYHYYYNESTLKYNKIISMATDNVYAQDPF